MNFSTVLAFMTAALTLIVVAVAIYRGRRSFVQSTFATGMFLFAVEAALTGMVFQAATLDNFLFWQRIRLTVSSLLPATWLMFSVSFARANYLEQISKWKWVIILAFVAPLMMTTLFHNAFIALVLAPLNTSTLFIRIGWAGYLWHIFWIVTTIGILMNLERTFRHSTGHIRWQTKFIFIGAVGIFGIRLFTQSQTILFQGVDTGLFVVNLGALLVADIFILRSLFRGKPMNVSIQLSHQFLYTSFTVVIVGVYFIALGLIAWISVHFEWLRNINLVIFLVFLTVVGLAVVLLSDRLRMKRKRFISRHLKRPIYDYQKIWENFTERTTSITNTRDLCDIIVRIVSETLEILSVSIWLVDEKQERLTFGGSTVYTAAQVENLNLFSQGGTDLIRAMSSQNMPVDLKLQEDNWVEDLTRTYELETKESRSRYCVPLNAAGQLIGIMTLSEKVFYEPLNFEESDLIKTIADQAAASLLNLRLSESLRQAKELEAFQTMSAFFMHDLKNLASKLSLVTQNLPLHMDNPEFRADALKTISQSVLKINTMSSRLGLLNRKIDLVFKETNINELIGVAVADAKKFVSSPIEQEIDFSISRLSIDQEQLYKVLENLFMNAYDATNPGGQIKVSSKLQDNWAVISVSDNGCGMSKDFIEKRLFRPFQTTKKQGMGIGLYHCKTIVDAHGGKLNVESEEGRGTTFKILLPIKKREE
ncbi:MAG: PEP-CTERM system histidine kinase PrsK [Deltaproteobacteria bacterium]|nr:PEP-CTERM system histidine kinase PrsK [Deltaproteobacteria bacterium]